MALSAKTFLFVLRHAHSAKAVADQQDFDRELDERGRREAGFVRREFAARGYAPERIACSSAVRTRQTLAAQHLDGAETLFSDDLYFGGVEAYLAAARGFGGAASGLIVGHNPMAVEFVALMTGSGEEDATRLLQDGMPPATLAVLEFSKPLAEIGAEDGVLKRLVPPRG